jgi:LacI family transcriptional regulator
MSYYCTIVCANIVNHACFLHVRTLRITLKDIARKSGFSVSIVSRVLNKKSAKYRISKETENRVLKTAKELNYRPNQLARGLRLKRTHTLGLVAPDLSNPFFASIIKSAQVVAHGLGYSLVVCDTDENVQMEIEHVNLLYNKGVDGMIVLPVGQRNSHLTFFVEHDVPLVLVDRVFNDVAANTVIIDNYGGAREAIEFLIARGHRKIAIIQGLPSTYTSNERLRGYRDALAHSNIPIDESLIVGKDFRKQNGYVETKFLLGRSERPTALFTTSDLITLGALEAIFEEGLEVPSDISVIAFDEVESAEFFRCPITVIAQPRETIGEIAVKLLIEQVRSPKKLEPRQIVLKPHLIIRESVARINVHAEPELATVS